MSKGIFGYPRLRGNSEAIVGGVYETTDTAEIALMKAGVGLSQVANTGSDQNITVEPFTLANGCVGISVAGDFGGKTKTISIVKEGLNIPVPVESGKTVALQKPVGLSATGKIIQQDDTDCAWLLNAVCVDTGVTALTADGVEVSGCVAIDLSMGGAPNPNYTP